MKLSREAKKLLAQACFSAASILFATGTIKGLFDQPTKWLLIWVSGPFIMLLIASGISIANQIKDKEGDDS